VILSRSVVGVRSKTASVNITFTEQSSQRSSKPMLSPGPRRMLTASGWRGTARRLGRSNRRFSAATRKDGSS